MARRGLTLFVCVVFVIVVRVDGSRHDHVRCRVLVVAPIGCRGEGLGGGGLVRMVVRMVVVRFREVARAPFEPDHLFAPF